MQLTKYLFRFRSLVIMIVYALEMTRVEMNPIPSLQLRHTPVCALNLKYPK